MVRCSYCWADSAEKSLFCVHCGKPIALTQLSAPQSRMGSRNKCPHCGADNPVGLKYCGKCGENIPSSPSVEEFEKSIPDEYQPIEDSAQEPYRQPPPPPPEPPVTQIPIRQPSYTQAQPPYQPQPVQQSAPNRNCISCGRTIIFDANVCPYCGHDYRRQITPQYQQQYPQKQGVSIGIKILVYLLSFFIPIIGFIIGAVYYTKPETRGVGKMCIILGILSLVLIVACYCVLYALIWTNSWYYY